MAGAMTPRRLLSAVVVFSIITTFAGYLQLRRELKSSYQSRTLEETGSNGKRIIGMTVKTRTPEITTEETGSQVDGVSSQRCKGNCSDVFAQKYANNYSQNTKDFFVEVDRIMKRKWKENRTVNQAFRDDLRAALGEEGKLDNFIVTKHHIQPGETIHFYRQNGSTTLSRQIWQLLPNDTVYYPRINHSCSVVGSSGILKGSHCGHNIDKADFVFRFNVADVKGFETDVGGKTNFTTLNPSFLVTKLNSLKTEEDRSQFVSILNQFNGSYLFLPAFALTWRYGILTRAASIAKSSNTVQPIFGHPDHFTSVTRLWHKTLKGSKWTTTGLYVLSSIFDLCERIDVYGFWPFPKTLKGRHVPYHYHNDIKAGSKFSHSFSTEFNGVMSLHEQGLIHLHLGACL
ncbi:CMP-N-acetylneuraminate-poly-alpha-2,8-sialyltransferase-like [Patiria miniata]|uniref:Uncharacterized protein n=1 Tax=Patiria miniata TaxID=46514 RepID=A0A914BPI6_PATMI|nr:CMP-N-acetylneuraminate-poly-alpha-2,8-sialyltransferase-like [Patiria miniata]